MGTDMSVSSSFVPLLLGILLSCSESETAMTAFTSTQSNPTFAVEGRDLTLEWTYNLDGGVILAQFFNVSESGVADLIAKGVGPGNATSNPKYEARFRAQATNTRAELKILAVQRSDQSMYRVDVAPSGAGTLTHRVAVFVHYKPNITFISGNQTANNSDVIWLNCTADGFPAPNITWTELSSNRIVNMPFTITGKHDEGLYKCTANNGIENPATAYVSIIVDSFSPINTAFSTNLTNAASLNETFCLMCSAEAKPAAEYRFYKEVKSLANITGGSQNIGIYATSLSDRVKQVVYNCIPFNSFGDGPMKTVAITVHYAVEAAGYGSNDTVTEGGEKNVSCLVDGNPEPNIKWYKGSEASGMPVSFKKVLTVKDVRKSVCYTCLANNSLGTSVSISQCLIVNGTRTTVSTRLSTTVSTPVTVSQQSTSAPSNAKPTTSEREGSPASLRIIIIAVGGGVVLLAIVVGVLTWWVYKRRKCRKDSKIHNSALERHDDEGGYSQVQGAYAQSGPPAANGNDGADEEEIEAGGAIPAYAVVDKSKNSKKQVDQKPPECAVVEKSQKKEKQEVAVIPTYAAVDKSKKKKKSREEVPAVYAEVDKSKKKKKKKIDDKNLYENLDEPKKEKTPGELLYADLGDFQNPSMPAVSISPQPLPAIKKADPYDRTDYADITQFLKGNANLPPNDGNGDTEMKPKRPSKKEIQGIDKETPI